MFKSTFFVTATAAFLMLAPAVVAQQQQDFSAVQIKATKLAANLFTLEGQGGTIGALVGPDGVFLVDSQFAPLTDKIVAAPPSSRSAIGRSASWSTPISTPTTPAATRTLQSSVWR